MSDVTVHDRFDEITALYRDGAITEEQFRPVLYLMLAYNTNQLATLIAARTDKAGKR